MKTRHNPEFYVAGTEPYLLYVLKTDLKAYECLGFKKREKNGLYDSTLSLVLHNTYSTTKHKELGNILTEA